MKKRIINVFIVILALFLSVPTQVLSASSFSDSEQSQKTVLADGSYFVTVFHENTEKKSSAKSSAYTKSGFKTVSYHDPNDELIWDYTLFASFTVTEGVSAVCTDASYSENIYQSGWSFHDGLAYSSGNTAYGEGLFKQKRLFITVNSITVDLSLSCDSNGNLS